MEGSSGAFDVHFNNPFLNEAMSRVEEDFSEEGVMTTSTEGEEKQRSIKPMPSKGNRLTRLVKGKMKKLGKQGSGENGARDDLRQLNEQLKTAAANLSGKKGQIEKSNEYRQAKQQFEFVEAELQRLQHDTPGDIDAIESKTLELGRAARAQNDIMDRGLKPEKEQWDTVKDRLDVIKASAQETKLKKSKVLKNLDKTEARIDELFDNLRVR